MTRNQHAFETYHHGGNMDPPEDHWDYYGCRCGLRYRESKWSGYAGRNASRKLHREHLAALEPLPERNE